MHHITLLVALICALALPPAVGAQPQAVDEPEPAGGETAEQPDAPASVKSEQSVAWAPLRAGQDGSTWIQLLSGEWVKGEIKDLYDGTLTFDSDELNEFEYDWGDVLAVITSRQHTVTTWDHQVYTGFIVARRGEIQVRDAEGKLIQSVPLDEISNLIQGRPREANYWSGKLSVGSTVRSGNSDQSDGSLSFDLNRRALILRWEHSFKVSYAEVGGVETKENYRYNSTFDHFISQSLFLRVVQYEYYRDPFQNIRSRHSPGIGLGFGRTTWSVDWDYDAGLVWQYTGYESVQAGEDSYSSELTGRTGLKFEWDITKEVDFDVTYSVNFPLARFSNYSSNFNGTLSFDLWWNLDFDLTMVWDRQNEPKPGADGQVPKQDDLQLTLGLGWEF